MLGISGVCKNILIFAKKEQPLLVKNKLGDIGEMSILIKSNDMN